MKETDQTRKLRIVLITALFSLVGFFLEVSPLGGGFSLLKGGPPIFAALSIEMQALGFLAYLALAAAAVVGLHLSEEEPAPEEEKEEGKEQPPPSERLGEVEAVRVRTRPELHQLKMFFTALGGYALLKGLSFIAMSRMVSPVVLFPPLRFGFFFVALGWFVLWQFLRWYARAHRWVRLQDELVGVDISRFIAVVILIEPVRYIIDLLLHGVTNRLLVGMTGLLELTLVAVSYFLWAARPAIFRRTLIGLAVCGVIAVLLVLLQGVAELYVVG